MGVGSELMWNGDKSFCSRQITEKYCSEIEFLVQLKRPFVFFAYLLVLPAEQKMYSAPAPTTFQLFFAYTNKNSLHFHHTQPFFLIYFH